MAGRASVWTALTKSVKVVKTSSIHNASRGLSQVVNSHNEWDPLEEIIVGRFDSPKVSPLTPDVKATLPKYKWAFYQENGGKDFPSDHVKKAQVEIENLCHVLEGEGIKVRRPDPLVTGNGFVTPEFSSSVKHFNNNPRDFLLVIGDKLIEAPMGRRDRYFEFQSYRTLIKEYFKEGAMWHAAPKPLMSDELFEKDYPFDDEEGKVEWTKAERFITTEFEPVFDAAEFLKCGKDIFAQRSHVTNHCGIEWLQRLLGDTYKIHVFKFFSVYALHIDASLFIPKPGIAVFNPELPCQNYDFFEKAGWKVMMAPSPTTPSSHPMYTSSAWLSMNTLMLDTERVIVEAQEYPMHEFFESIGVKCIKVPFRNAYSFGGGIHCYTCDIRRKGELQSYF